MMYKNKEGTIKILIIANELVELGIDECSLYIKIGHSLPEILTKKDFQELKSFLELIEKEVV